MAVPNGSQNVELNVAEGGEGGGGACAEAGPPPSVASSSTASSSSSHRRRPMAAAAAGGGRARTRQPGEAWCGNNFYLVATKEEASAAASRPRDRQGAEKMVRGGPTGRARCA